MSDLEEFLRGRRVPEYQIKKLSDDKIDHSTLPLVDEETLKTYLPLYGDRLAAIAYCRSKSPECPVEDSKPTANEPRTSLLERLKAKRGSRRWGSAGSGHCSSGNKSEKPSRKIELGWKDWNDKCMCYKQVRSQNGGGTRELTVERHLGEADLLKEAKNLFHDGILKRGNPDDFSYRLRDFQMREIGDKTVGELYTETKVRMLRLYVITQKKSLSVSEDASEENDTQGPQNSSIDGSSRSEMPRSDTETDSLPDLTATSEEQNLYDQTEQVGTPDNTLTESCSNSLRDEEQDWPLSRDIPTDTPTITFSRLPAQRRRLRLQSRFTSDMTVTEAAPQMVDFPPENTKCNANESLHEILTRLWSTTEGSGSPKNIVNVTRRCVMSGARRAFARPSFNPARGLSVKFAGEDGIDDGGLSREFLRLLMVEISQSNIFVGSEKTRMLDLNYSALHAGTYETFGKMIAYSIVHRGPLPSFFHPVLFEAMVSGIDAVTPEIDDLVDPEHRDQILQVSRAEHVSDLDSVSELIHMAGCSAMSMDIGRKQELSKALIHFLILGRISQCFVRFCDGLKTLGVLNEIRHHGDKLKELFCYQEDALTASKMDKLFTTELSEEGSNRRAEEETVLASWRDLLLDLEEEKEPISLTNVLVYVTGADAIPPLGFVQQPTLKFHASRTRDPESRENFPTANTCANILDLPLVLEYDTFKRNVLAAMRFEYFTSE